MSTIKNDFKAYLYRLLIDFRNLLILYTAARLIHIFILCRFFHTLVYIEQPITYYRIWILSFLIVLYFFIKKIGYFKEPFNIIHYFKKQVFNEIINEIIKFIMSCIIFGLLGIYSSKITRWAFHEVKSIDRFEFIEHDYFGISGINLSLGYDNLINEEVNDNEYTNYYVFLKGDRSGEIQFNSILNKSESIDITEFIFWQTALANGFDTKYIPNHDKQDITTKKTETYFTVGPLVIIESIVNALKDTFLIFIGFILYRIPIIKKKLNPRPALRNL